MKCKYLKEYKEIKTIEFEQKQVEKVLLDNIRVHMNKMTLDTFEVNHIESHSNFDGIDDFLQHFTDLFMERQSYKWFSMTSWKSLKVIDLMRFNHDNGEKIPCLLCIDGLKSRHLIGRAIITVDLVPALVNAPTKEDIRAQLEKMITNMHVFVIPLEPTKLKEFSTVTQEKSLNFRWDLNHKNKDEQYMTYYASNRDDMDFLNDVIQKKKLSHQENDLIALVN